MQRPADEELANTLTHALGVALALGAAAVMLPAAAAHADSWMLPGCSAYAAALVLVYAASTLSHWLIDPQAKRRMRAWDQGLIYLLIAGSFTPYGLAYLPDGSWRWLLAAVWTLAGGGFASKVLLGRRINSISTVSYLGLAWLPMTGIRPMFLAAPAGAVVWAVAGGACYMAGVAVLICDHKARYLHALWHLLVIAGSVCQFLGVYWYVLA